METWFQTNEHITNKYKGFEHYYPIFKRGIFLDTAPLFILICGNYDKNNNTKLIENFNAKENKIVKDRQYKIFDYNYLIAFLNSLDLKQIPLLITPYIFTEFIRHLWTIVDNPKQFRDVIEKSFKTKSYLKDSTNNLCCYHFFSDDLFLNKELEIGDISIIISIKEFEKDKGPRTILTSDEPFALISANKYKFITIYYEDIRTATFQLGYENIPKEFLKDI